MLISAQIPPPKDLRQIREHLGLSQPELSESLGFSPGKGPQTVRDWECGFRYGEPFAPTPLAWCALRYLLTVVEIYRGLDKEDPESAKIAHLLPECLR